MNEEILIQIKVSEDDVEKKLLADRAAMVQLKAALVDLNKERNYQTEQLNTDLRLVHCDLMIDNNGLRALAKEAVDMATNALGPNARHN